MTVAIRLSNGRYSRTCGFIPLTSILSHPPLRIRNSSDGHLSGQQGGSLLTASMGGDRGGEIGQNIDALKITGFGDRQQTSRGQLALGAAIAEADFSPLHSRAERSFGAIVGGFNAFLFEKGKQPLVVLEQCCREIADLAVGSVQVPLGQSENPLLYADRTQKQLVSIDLATAKLVPEAEE